MFPQSKTMENLIWKHNKIAYNLHPGLRGSRGRKNENVQKFSKSQNGRRPVVCKCEGINLSNDETDDNHIDLIFVCAMTVAAVTCA